MIRPGGNPVSDRGGRPEARRIPAVAALLAGSVLISRVMGYAREMVLAAELGAGAEVDAYRAAFQIPDILNYFLAGGAFTIAFVPFYTRAREGQGEDAARRLTATVLGTMTVLAIGATALLWWQAEPLIALQFGSFAPETQALTVRLTRIVLPAQIFFVAGGIIRAVLMANDRFASQALAPILYNGAIIASGLLLARHYGPDAFAWGVLVGAVLGPFLLPLLDARRAGLALGFRVAPWAREFLAFLAVAAPLMLGLSLLTVDEWYEKWFGARVGEGVVAQIGYARQLMLLPVAVVGQAMATAALPALSALWTAGRTEEFERVLGNCLRAVLALGVLGAVGAAALAEPIVVVLFQRGAFTADATARVAELLEVLAFAVPAWVVQQVAVRGFYARSDMWRPALLGTAVALAAVPLYLRLGDLYGARGLALAGVLGMSVYTLLTLLMLRVLHGGPQLRVLLESGGRALLVALPAGLATVWVAGRIEPALGRLVLGGAAFAMIAIPGTWLLGDEAMREALRRLLGRLRRSRS
jgi:putative peptidoglycan lipid II flippase